MFQHLVVPVDGSQASYQAVSIASRMAAAVGGTVEAVQVLPLGLDPSADYELLVKDMARMAETLPVAPTAVAISANSVAGALAPHVAERPGAVVAMSSRGRGRTSLMLGSIANDILHEIPGPTIVFGPQIDPDAGRLDGMYIIPVDGSAVAEQMAPAAVEWAFSYGAVPCLVEVLAPGSTPSDVTESAYLMRMAQGLSESSSKQVQFEALRGSRPATAILDHVKTVGASLIFMSTHGRTGLARLRMGSVAADVVRRSPVPVVLQRPNGLSSE